MKISVNRNFILATFLFAFLVMGFQNCKQTEKGEADLSEQQSSSGVVVDGNGQPYDGKPYVVAKLCEDGTIVSSRLVMKADGSATLFRKNCETLQPTAIAPGQIVSVEGGLRFSEETYTLEKPALPLPGTIRWNYQLTGAWIEQGAPLIVVDAFNEDASSIAAHKANNKIVICSLSAGTRESWQSDFDQFPPESIGVGISSEEFYIDIRHSIVKQIMVNRIDALKAMGCRGINFDNVDGFSNTTGFSISAAEQIYYNQFLAFAAHDRGLIMALNNVPELSEALSEFFEMAITEQCFQFNECDRFQSFTRLDKPVFAVEYTDFSQSLCDQAADLSLSLIFTNQELDGNQYSSCL